MAKEVQRRNVIVPNISQLMMKNELQFLYVERRPIVFCFFWFPIYMETRLVQCYME